MLKIQLMSDLHLEFDPFFRPKNTGSDVLILSGDICVANVFTKSEASPKAVVAKEFKKFFDHVTTEWQDVIYVAGNHEHYHGYFDTTLDILKDTLQYENLHILDNDTIDIDGVRFFGATLWTDVNTGDPITENFLRGAMNDFKLIQWKSKGYKKFSPFDCSVEHLNTKIALDKAIADHDNVVVVGHHAPSFQSIHPMYHNNMHMNGGYYSELTEFIIDHPQIKLWTHGHTHNNADYDIENTKVWCNPRGYNDENPYFNPDKIVTIQC